VGLTGGRYHGRERRNLTFRDFQKSYAAIYEQERAKYPSEYFGINQAELRVFLGCGQPLRVVDRDLEGARPRGDPMNAAPQNDAFPIVNSPQLFVDSHPFSETLVVFFGSLRVFVRISRELGVVVTDGKSLL
jgi:hypothetical protein